MTAADRCRAYRRRILEISQQVSALHVAPAFSCLEILDTIYHDLRRPNDIVILSKGHAAIAQYVILESLGVLSQHDLGLFCKNGGRLGTHPDLGTPGIAASTGSLGHGLGIAAGQAYAEKLKGSDIKVYCVLSDGELQEGSTWEAMTMASNLALDNLMAFVDYNDFGGLERMPAHFNPVAKARSFGWIADYIDGHQSDSLRQNARFGYQHGNKPAMLVCNTVKGKGVSYMEHKPIWHYRSPNKDEYQQALVDLG